MPLVVGAVGVLDSIETFRDAVNAAEGKQTIYVTYYFEDEGGQFHYELKNGGFGIFYRGTDKVYETGEREPAFYFWARIRCVWKSIVDPPRARPQDLIF